MKHLLKTSLGTHFSMVFMAFIVFSTNNFTTKYIAINIIASIILIGIYLVLFYTDAFNVTCMQIRNRKRPVNPLITSVILYIIPVIMLIWGSIAPLYYDVIVSGADEEPQFEYSETGELVITDETKANAQNTVTEKAVRQEAWFNLYMQPYKGIYHMTGGSMAVKIITLLLTPLVSVLGYINAKRGKDFLRIAEKRFRKMVYHLEDEI